MSYALIVEDELFVALHIQEVLERAGFRSTVVSHGQEALVHLEEHGAPGLIVTDLQMPVMGGVQLAAALKKDERWRDVPVLAISGALVLRGLFSLVFVARYGGHLILNTRSGECRDNRDHGEPTYSVGMVLKRGHPTSVANPRMRFDTVSANKKDMSCRRSPRSFISIMRRSRSR